MHNDVKNKASCLRLDKDYLGWGRKSSKSRCRELRHGWFLRRDHVTCFSLTKHLAGEGIVETQDAVGRFKYPKPGLSPQSLDREQVSSSSGFHGWDAEAVLGRQAPNSLSELCILLFVTTPMNWTSAPKRDGRDTRVGESEGSEVVNEEGCSSNLQG